MQYSYWLYTPQNGEDDMDPMQNADEDLESDELSAWEAGFIRGANAAA